MRFHERVGMLWVGLLVGVAACTADTSCPAAVCAAEPTVLLRWMCVGRFLMPGAPAAGSQSAGQAKYLDHGMTTAVGFGNNIKAVYISAAVALLSDRHLIVQHDKMARMFDARPFRDVAVPLPQQHMRV